MSLLQLPLRVNTPRKRSPRGEEVLRVKVQENIESLLEVVKQHKASQFEDQELADLNIQLAEFTFDKNDDPDFECFFAPSPLKELKDHEVENEKLDDDSGLRDFTPREFDRSARPCRRAEAILSYLENHYFHIPRAGYGSYGTLSDQTKWDPLW
ncbi:hypothetical protein VTN77DRAFT_4690 [Rasamsonia byssochlamydoides]|uniref:uncharacterized protein n=1 Tax=Rasamsonia byssochlamydoides TaxID=89139 RepID=UPI0037423E4F